MNLDHPIPRLNMPKYSYLPITSEKIPSNFYYSQAMIVM